MKKLIDKRPKANHAIRDSFIILPEKMTAKQRKILDSIKLVLSHYDWKEDA